MKKLMTICTVVIISLVASQDSMAATDFYAITNEIGYSGTIWNVTDSTGPWTTTTPRDGYLYTAVNVPGFSTDYNYLMSNWSEHSVSNTNNSFLQLAEAGNPSVTSASASWDATKTVFSMTVTGSNAPYATSNSRMWQPDTTNSVAWSVTFTDYTYSFTATFSQAAAIDTDGWLSNTVAPDTITGTFSGQFVPEVDYLKNPITDGDTYGFNIGFSKALFVPLDTLDAYGETTSVMNYFGVVPEPATMSLLGFGALTLLRRKRKV